MSWSLESIQPNLVLGLEVVESKVLTALIVSLLPIAHAHRD